MRRLSIRRSRSATSPSRRDQSRSASSTAKSADGASSKSCCSLARGSPGSLSMRAITSSVPRLLPGVEHLVEQRLAILEMPVEAALGHPQGRGQRLDPHGVRALLRQGLQRRVDPCVAWSPDLGHRISIRHRIDRCKRPCLRSIRHRMDRGASMRTSERGTRISAPGASARSRRTSPWRTSGPCPCTAAPRTSKRCSSARSSSDPADADSLPDALPLGPPRPPRQLVRPRQDLGPPIDGDDAGELPIPGTSETSLSDRLPDDLRDTAADLNFRLPALRPPLPHRHRVRRGAVEPDRPRRDAPGLGRPGRGPLPGADGRLRQAARPVRERRTWR